MALNAFQMVRPRGIDLPSSEAPTTIEQLTLKGEVFARYNSAWEAHKAGFDHAHVLACANGRARTHAGFKWRWAKGVK